MLDGRLLPTNPYPIAVSTARHAWHPTQILRHPVMGIDNIDVMRATSSEFKLLNLELVTAEWERLAC